MQQALMVLGFHYSAIKRSPSPRPPPGRGRSERALRNGSPFGDSSQHLESEPTLLGERFPGNDNSRVEIPEPMENIEHPTSNTERRSERGFALSFDVRRWMFDVGCSSGFMESLHGLCPRIGTMNQNGTPLPALSPQGGERVAEGRERGGSWRDFPETKLRALNPEPGGDGALRRPRRVQRRNDAAR